MCLLQIPAKEVVWPEVDGIRRPSVRLDNHRTLSFVWPAFQVAQVLWRLEEINREVGRDRDRVDKDRQWAQLLQLFFIDIIDSCSALETFHTKWDPRTWTRICQELPSSLESTWYRFSNDSEHQSRQPFESCRQCRRMGSGEDQSTIGT